MRRNLPVTQREYKLPPAATLLSTTDRQGRITYANGAFIEASGFSREELMGQPHNIVRHPDMPPAAFADLWRTIGSGRPWSALVKNRRKDGDHYWVRANAVAMRRAGEIVGYLSVRTSPGEAEVAAAERLYAEMRAGRARHLALQGGVVVRRGLLGWLAVGQRLPLAARVGVGVALAAGPGLLAHALLAVGAVPAPVLPLAAALGAACGFGWLWVQLIAPLRRITGQALAVASGQAVRPIVFDRVDASAAAIATGGDTVGQAGRTIDDVVVQVDKVSALIAEITAVSTEQASGIGQVGQAVSTLDDTTQQNAALVEQSAAAAESLRQQSGRLAEAVGVYRAC
jgi:aerotaxis receptor